MEVVDIIYYFVGKSSTCMMIKEETGLAFQLDCFLMD